MPAKTVSPRNVAIIGADIGTGVVALGVGIDL
jgi:hypothetical protein